MMKFNAPDLWAILLTLFSITSCVHDPFPPRIVKIIAPVTEDDSTEITAPDCDSDSVYFENDILPLFRSNCAISGCHDDITAEKGIILTNYTDIVSTGEIEPGEPAKSEVYEVISESDPDKRMPPPPSDPLSNQNIELIGKWILQGAPNNKCNDCESYDNQFSSSVWPIIEANCTGCHSGASPQGGVLLSTFSEIEFQAINGALGGSLSGDSSYQQMPYNLPSLDSCTVNSILNWIDEGYQEN